MKRQKHLTSRGERLFFSSFSAWPPLPLLYSATSTSLLYLFIRSFISSLLYLHFFSTSPPLPLCFSSCSSWSRRLSLGAVDKFVRFMQSCLITLPPSPLPSLFDESLTLQKWKVQMSLASISVSISASVSLLAANELCGVKWATTTNKFHMRHKLQSMRDFDFPNEAISCYPFSSNSSPSPSF